MKKHGLYHDQSMFKGAPIEGFAKAERLRDNMTQAEKLVWEHLKGKKLLGFKFRRQHPIQKYIVDFYCHEFGLIVEIDGGYHEEKEQKFLDMEREELLKFQNLHIIRFTNEEVLSDIDTVIRKIEGKINSLKSS